MADHSIELVENLSAGDLIWNPILESGVRIRQIIEGPEPEPLIELGYGDTLVSVTQGHPVHTRNGVKTARELMISDEVMDTAGEYHQLAVLRVLPVEPDQLVINFEIDTDSEDPNAHMFVSDGIVTGDLWLQRRLGAGLL